MKLLVYSDLHLDPDQDLSPFTPQLDPDFRKTVDVGAHTGDTTEDTGVFQRSWL